MSRKSQPASQQSVEIQSALQARAADRAIVIIGPVPECAITFRRRGHNVICLDSELPDVEKIRLVDLMLGELPEA